MPMTLDDLIAYGADVEEGLGRCMGNEALYLRLVETARVDEGFEKLQGALQEQRLGDAFEIAHALKGALANLAIMPLYQPVKEITELLRAKTAMDYGPLLQAILEERDRLCAL